MKRLAEAAPVEKKGGCQICKKPTSTKDSFQYGKYNKMQHRYCTLAGNSTNLCDYCARGIEKTSTVMNKEAGKTQKIMACRRKGVNSGDIKVTTLKLSSSQENKAVKKETAMESSSPDNKEAEEHISPNRLSEDENTDDARMDRIEGDVAAILQSQTEMKQQLSDLFEMISSRLPSQPKE